MLHLNCGAAGVVETPGWDALANGPMQTLGGRLSYDTFETLVPDKTVVPLLDRNAFTEPWRRVLVVRVGDNAYVFNKAGEAINEPKDGVAGGIQPLHGDEGTFLDDMKHQYYASHDTAEFPSLDEAELEERREESAEEAEGEQLPTTHLKDTLCAGRRIALSFGTEPIMWFGGLIDEVRVC